MAPRGSCPGRTFCTAGVAGALVVAPAPAPLCVRLETPELADRRDALLEAGVARGFGASTVTGGKLLDCAKACPAGQPIDNAKQLAAVKYAACVKRLLREIIRR